MVVVDVGLRFQHFLRILHAWHAVAFACPAATKYPAGHVAHPSLALRQYVPPAQLVQSDRESWSAAIRLASETPASMVWRPGGHARQLVEVVVMSSGTAG